MKKLIALCLATCVGVCSFASCGETTPPVVETTASTTETNYQEENNVLTSCVGLADENGVYIVPDHITAIGESAFAGDERVKEIVVGANVKTIGSGAFQYCTALRKITLPEGLESIGSHAFYGCSSLEEIQLPTTVNTLEAYVFYGCEALESLSLENIRKINNAALWYCTSLQEVTLSADLEVLGDWAFAQCQSLEAINLEDCTKLTAIGDYAFAACSMLRSLSLPASLQKIGKLVFYSCTRLTSIDVPASVSNVDFGAFNYTPWFQENDEDYLIVGDGVLIKCTVHPEKLDLSGKGIKHLGGSVFWNAETENTAADYGYKYAWELENVIIPEGVETIGTSAFAGCWALKNVTLPSTILRIEDNAFNLFSDGVTVTANIDLSACKNLTHIGHYAFYGCSGIEQISLAPSVKSVGEYAFAVTGAQTKFYKENESKTENAFFITGDGVLLFSYIADGQTAVIVPDGVKVIGGAAFSGWDTAMMPESTDSLSTSGKSKYNLSYAVTTLTLPESVETIGASAFYRMQKLQAIDLPSALMWIDSYAFAFCEDLTNLSGGENLREVGDYAFYYCSAIPGFRFSANTEAIGSYVFNGCASLKTVYFPENLKFLGENIFAEGCASLTGIYISSAEKPRIYAVVGAMTQNLKIAYYE